MLEHFNSSAVSSQEVRESMTADSAGGRERGPVTPGNTSEGEAA